MAIASSLKVTVFLRLAPLAGLFAFLPVGAQSHETTQPNGHSKISDYAAAYEKWLDEDVRWIISAEERAAFVRLSKDEERDRFVEQFWIRRDPTPGTVENEYKEEHYRRIAYANEHFAAARQGWTTDRGRIYIVYGPPDEIQSRPRKDDSESSTVLWRYRSNPKLGSDVELKFVDVCNCGDYRLQPPRN